MPEVDRCYLWLLPEPAARVRLRGLIAALAERLGTPRFEPHVNLLGEVRVQRGATPPALASLAAELRAMELAPLAVEAGLGYYRCVYLRFAPTAALWRARERAAQRLLAGPAPRRVSAPPEPGLGGSRLGAAPALARGLGGRGFGTLRVDRLALVRGGRRPGAWRELETAALSGRARNAH